MPVVPDLQVPSWTQLSASFQLRCRTGVPSDSSVFRMTIVKQRDNTYKPHTFCPVSASYEHFPQYVLSGITRFSPTTQNASMPFTMYLSSFASASIQGTYCFGVDVISYRKLTNFIIMRRNNDTFKVLKEIQRFGWYFLMEPRQSPLMVRSWLVSRLLRERLKSF